MRTAYQCHNGAFSGELCRAKQISKEPINEPMIGILLVVVFRDQLFLEENNKYRLVDRTSADKHRMQRRIVRIVAV